MYVLCLCRPSEAGPGGATLLFHFTYFFISFKLTQELTEIAGVGWEERLDANPGTACVAARCGTLEPPLPLHHNLPANFLRITKLQDCPPSLALENIRTRIHCTHCSENHVNFRPMDEACP
jgi:hypothetical protein